MYLLPKPKTIKEQDGQMLLCHSTHIVMTKEVAETEMPQICQTVVIILTRQGDVC